MWNYPRLGIKWRGAKGLETVESVKAVEELFSPIGGTIIDCNTALEDSPEILSDDPYGDGWLVKVEITDASDLEDTLSVEEYQNLVEGH